MDKAVAQKILDIQESMRNHEDFPSLQEEHNILNARFLKTVETLTQTQKDAIFDYIGLLIEIHLRTLESAVS